MSNAFKQIFILCDDDFMYLTIRKLSQETILTDFNFNSQTFKTFYLIIYSNIEFFGSLFQVRN
jgi:hypothetical protein